MSQTPSATGGPAVQPWAIVITDWALDSYLNLKHAQVFSDLEYWNVLRPDVELLRTGIPSPEPKFANSTVWGPAKQGTAVLPSGYKMKWHNLGPGRVQLRLPVMAGQRIAFLCQAYVKSSEAVDQRRMAVFKSHMNLIFQGRYTYRGTL